MDSATAFVIIVSIVAPAIVSSSVAYFMARRYIERQKTQYKFLLDLVMKTNQVCVESLMEVVSEDFRMAAIDNCVLARRMDTLGKQVEALAANTSKRRSSAK